MGLKSFSVSESGNNINLNMLEVPKGSRKQGIGTKAMEELARYADKKGKRIILEPGLADEIHGTTSRSRLVKFYKKLGFKESKGRNIDYEIGAGKMYRYPNEK